MTEDGLIQISMSAIQTFRPEWGAEFVPPFIIHDFPNYWEVTTKLPEREGYFVLGGGPAVQIDKKSLQIIKVIHYQ